MRKNTKTKRCTISKVKKIKTYTNYNTQTQKKVSHYIELKKMAGGHTRGKKKVVTKHQQKRSETNNVSNEEPGIKIMENTSEGIIILKAIESLSTAVLGVKNDIACVKRDVNGVKKELNDKMDTQNTNCEV